MQLLIHYHFRFASALLANIGRNKRITFEHIPFFKLYDMHSLPEVRTIIDVLRVDGMPHHFQSIIKKLKPTHSIADSHYREELIYMTYCKFNRQSFFVRAYRLRQKDFFKIEVTLHSDTLGQGKYFDLSQASRAARTFFNKIEENSTSLDPTNRHMKDYFIYDSFKKMVGVFEIRVNTIKKVKNKRTRDFLKGKLLTRIKDFQKNSRRYAEQALYAKDE